MCDGLGFTGSKDGVAPELGSALGNELGFDASKIWARAVGVGDREGVGWDGGERTERVMQDLQGLVTSVGESCRDFKVRNTANSRGT